MFGWKSALIGAVLVGVLKVANAYHRDANAHPLQQRDEMLSHVAGEMVTRAQDMVDGELITRARVHTFSRYNWLRVILSTSTDLNDLQEFGKGMEDEVSSIVCGQHLNTTLRETDLTIQLIMETKQREPGIDIRISKATCLAKGFT